MGIPSISSNQIAIDPIDGIFYFKNSNGVLVGSSLNVLQASNTQITTEDGLQVSGNLVVDGNLIVNGTTVTINTESIVVEDKNIELGFGITTNANASGGGITLKGATDKTFNWINSTGSWTSSEDMNLVSGKVYKINGVEVLSATAYAGSASKWTNSRTITLAGDLTGNVSIDGSADVTLTAAVATNSVALGTDTTGDYVSSLVAGLGISVADNSGETSTPTVALNASIDNLTDVTLSSPANGDFFRYNGSVWVNDAINLSTDTIGDYVDKLAAGTGIIITNNSGEASVPIISLPQSIATNANVAFNQVTSSIVGDVTGNVTGNIVGNVTGNVVGNITGNVVGDTSGIHTGNVTGTASNALVWTNQRKITLDGDVTGEFWIDGSANATLTTTIATNAVALGTDTTGDYVANLVAGTGITVTGNSGETMTPVVKVSDSYTSDMLSNIANSAASVSTYVDAVGNTAYSNSVTYINTRTLDDLTGVTLSNAIPNQFLKFNGSVWINDSLDFGDFSSSFTLTNLQDNDVLLWDTSTNTWVNGIIPESVGVSLTTTIGDGSSTSIPVNHNFDRSDVVVSTTMLNTTSNKYEVINVGWEITNSNVVTFFFETPPENNSVKASIFTSVQSTSLQPTSLSGLVQDVTIGSLSANQSLLYNGTKWVNRKIIFNTDLDNVDISSPTSGQVLKYDGTVWVNDTDNTGTTINILNDIPDVTITSAQNGDLLQWGGNAWVNIGYGVTLASPTFTGTVIGVSKSMVGLGDVDNTSDVNKPVSVAAQTALAFKANLASPTFTGTVTVPTPTNNTDAVTKAYVDSTASIGFAAQYKIGDTGPGGGTIFFVDRFNEYDNFDYLEMGPVNTHSLKIWAPSGYQNSSVAGADSKALGAGYQNTIDIIAQGHIHTSAAYYCDTLTSGGQSDWYLPSIAELIMLYNNLYLNIGIVGFGADYYWSSSEFTSNDRAWAYLFSDSYNSGLLVTFSKDTSAYVCPVRRFS